jgi:SAM-dependent methyltransferase
MHGTPFWDQRYGATGEYVFGTEPNDFLRAMAPRLAQGRVLCLAEGEGRNAIHLARLGHEVVAVDQSAVGLEKARRLAARYGVGVKTVVADLAEFDPGQGEWSAVVWIFLHLPAPLRKVVLRRAVQGLNVGGALVFEAYTPRQLVFGTGGPKEAGLLVELEDLRGELDGLDLVVAREVEREVVEGSGHTGRAAVVQVFGVKR